VRQRANLEGATAFVPDAEVTDALNESLAETYDLIRLAVGDNYYRSQFGITTITGQALYTLPADFLALISVDVLWSSSISLSAKKFTEAERNIFKFWNTGWVYNQPVYYQEQGSNIALIPTPTSAVQVNLNYVPACPKLANPGDLFDGVNGWEEHAVLDAAIKLLIKDGDAEMLTMLESRKARIEARIQQFGAQRGGMAERVQDLASNYDAEIF
jgi:hypothetical protein